MSSRIERSLWSRFFLPNAFKAVDSLEISQAGDETFQHLTIAHDRKAAGEDQRR